MKRDPLPLAATLEPVASAARDAWRAPLAALAIAQLVVLACYFGTAASMVEVWANSATYTHGFVVVPITLWLIWRIRARLRTMVPRPSPAVLPLFALAGLVWLLGEFGGVNAVSQSALVAMLVLTVPAILGLHVARAMMFPLGFVFFAVPIGDFLLPALMERTADFTVAALRMSGVPVYREGFLMVLPTGQWSVVEACSGVRYLIASLMVGTLFAYLNYRANWRRFVFVGVAIAVPIVANWLRAYLIVMLGHLSNNRLAVGVDHLIYGWLFFGFVMLLMFWVGAKWREPGAPREASVARPIDIGRDLGASLRSRVVVVTAIAAIAFAWPALEFATAPPDGTPIALAQVDVPGWQRVAREDAAWEPHFEAPSATLQESLVREGVRGGIYIAYYRNQDSRRKVVNSENRLASSEGGRWIRTIEGERDIPLADARTRVSTATLRGPRDARIVAWQWYWINGTVTSSDAVAKLLTAWLRLTGRSDDSASIIMYVEDLDPPAASETLDALVRSAWPAVRSLLNRESGRGDAA